MVVDDKYIGLALATLSTLAIGTSFVITKKGLNDAADKHGFEGDGFAYLKTPLWWAGIASLVVGEIANFAAYAFAPAILVTPLGALSVLIGAILGAQFLDEQLGVLGKLGCSICLLGSVVIVLHAPPDEPIEEVETLLHYAIQPGFIIYCLSAIVFCFVMIYKVAPKYGKKNPLVFISICSVSGSVSVMSVKAFGIALKLTLAGNNQLTHPSTYVFAIVCAVCILTQMNYLNKALSQFTTSIVNPLYYVTFTTATLCASFILFQGFNTTDAVNTISLLCGFLIIFAGVYLLNLSRGDPDGHRLINGRVQDDDGIPTDPLSSITSRRSMQLRRSFDPHRRSNSITYSPGPRHASSESAGLMYNYDVEHNAFGLTDLVEDDTETSPVRANGTARTPSPAIKTHEERPKAEPRIGHLTTTTNWVPACVLNLNSAVYKTKSDPSTITPCGARKGLSSDSIIVQDFPAFMSVMAGNVPDQEANNPPVLPDPIKKDDIPTPSQKAVTIFDEPHHIEPPEYDSPASASPKLHRASISGRKMTGRPNIQQSSSSSSINKIPSYLALDEAIPPEQQFASNIALGSSGADAMSLLTQVNDWLADERSKRSSKHRSGVTQTAIDSARSSRSDADLDLDKLERILAGFASTSLGGSGKPSRKSSVVSLRRGSLLKKSHRSSQPGASSDTEWQDGDILVPHVEASLDNSKTLAYLVDAGSADSLTKKDQKHWDQFKQDIVRLTHTLKIRGWRRIPIDQGTTIQVERLSGALTNAVYVVKPPKVLPEPEPTAEGTKPYLSKSKPLELILRIYGPQAEHLIDREEELGILRRLARKRIGPCLLGYFTNGRFEEFLHAKTLAAEDLRVPETSKQIAKRMRELHDGIELLPSEREAGPRAFNNFDKWVERCDVVVPWLDKQVILEQQGKKAASKRYTRRGFVCGVEWEVFRRAYYKYRAWLIEKHGGMEGVRSRLVFAHNDTQYGNLMRLDPPGESPLLQPANQHRQLVVIDFEYASASPPGYEFANHFAEWCYNYHHAELSYACNTKSYPTPAEQYRFMKAYVVHRPQYAPAASATPKMEGKEKTNLSDFMLDARAPGGPQSIDYDAEERAREEKVESDIEYLLHETKLWRIENSAWWVAWGIVQASIPELDEPKQSTVGALLDSLKSHLVARSDPLDKDVEALQEASKHDRPEDRASEKAHAEGDVDAGDEEKEEDFDYLSYAQERAMFFWGDCLQLGIVKEADLPESLLKQVKLVKI